MAERALNAQLPFTDGDALARVGLYARSETRFFLIALARFLRARHGSSITLYSGNSQESDFYARYGGDAFAEIVEAKTLHTAALETPLAEDEEIRTAQHYETQLGQTYNFLSVSNRHLGRGYALAGFYHPRSRISEETKYVNLLHAYNEVLRFWEREIGDRRLTLVINGPREAAVMARRVGVPYRAFAGSRYRNFHNWAWNEYYENPEFQFAYKASEGGGDFDLDQPYHSHLVNRSKFLREASSLHLAGRAGYEIVRSVWWKFRGYEKARGYYLSENLALMYRIWSDRARLARLAKTTLNDLNGKRFVYFPLHQEPEMALQGLSPEYFYQLSSIAAIARDLPAGTRLAVKETFGAIGRRPRDFYAQIAELKNVVMLEPLELGLECARHADAVVTICGTAGLEAAVLGKPVIVFGQHNIYNFLPHVKTVTRESELGSYLRECLAISFDATAARASGLSFLKAVVARSFDMRGYDFINVEKFDPQTVEDACAALLRGLSVNMHASAPEKLIS